MSDIPEKQMPSELVRQILLHGKDDMITVEMVHRRHFRDSSIEAARSAIRRLCGPDPENHFLEPEFLDSHRVYYRLTPLATKTLGICTKYAQPLKSLGRVHRYALSWFLHGEHPGQRILFSLADFKESFGLQNHRLSRHPFFLDTTTDRERIGMILVDHNAHVRQIVHKTIKPLGRFLRWGWFTDFIMAGCFIVAILTFSASRQRAIQRQLEDAIEKHLAYALAALRTRSPEKTRIEVQVHVIPGMNTVLLSPSRRR